MSGDSLEVSEVAELTGEAEGYRAINHWAVLTLILGLASALVLVHPILAILPVLTLVSGAVALRQISYYWPAYTGRWAALAGIWFALVFAIATPTRIFLWRYQMETEAIRFGDQFMRMLLDGRAIEAHQLTVAKNIRMPPDETMYDSYRADPARKEGVRAFVAEPAVHTLLALGPQATARLYEVESLYTNGDAAAAALLYAVTYDDRGTRRTFFVRLIDVRESHRSERAGWRVHRVFGDVYPGSKSEDETQLPAG
ncbi:MAG: hypothetical protein KF708_24445 [Pirellulales bacterium]|nr:hypothetical protein [Pirellulales bacterium]